MVPNIPATFCQLHRLSIRSPVNSGTDALGVKRQCPGPGTGQPEPPVAGATTELPLLRILDLGYDHYKKLTQLEHS